MILMLRSTLLRSGLIELFALVGIVCVCILEAPDKVGGSRRFGGGGEWQLKNLYTYGTARALLPML